uniref:early nodulin-20-like n=1 Tax=Fragaria vesca subsp. vesca TaxID=101020 RepID=UPI0005CAD4AC|nr:PREDICTED: early nodulin-20-like [Fragaria vesca subsp. vesca]
MSHKDVVLDLTVWHKGTLVMGNKSCSHLLRRPYHNVIEVTKQGFESCDPSSPIAAYDSGSDNIMLERLGHYYFLCGIPGHCNAEQKVEVVVNNLPTPANSPVSSPSLAPFGLASPSTPSPTPSSSPSSTPSSTLSALSTPSTPSPTPSAFSSPSSMPSQLPSVLSSLSTPSPTPSGLSTPSTPSPAPSPSTPHPQEIKATTFNGYDH